MVAQRSASQAGPRHFSTVGSSNLVPPSPDMHVFAAVRELGATDRDRRSHSLADHELLSLYIHWSTRASIVSKPYRAKSAVGASLRFTTVCTEYWRQRIPP